MKTDIGYSFYRYRRYLFHFLPFSNDPKKIWRAQYDNALGIRVINWKNLTNDIWLTAFNLNQNSLHISFHRST